MSGVRRRNQKVQIVRVSFIALIICLGVFCGYVFSRVLFKSLSVPTPTDSLKSDPILPGYVLKEAPVVIIERPIDAPELSIFMWFKVSAEADEEKVVLLSNRDIDCEERKKSVGYSIYYSVKDKRITILWRTKKSRCEMETISEIIHPEAWTHITVVFRPMEDNLSEDVLAELVYPMIMEVYLNGRLMTTRTSIRFIADNRQELAIGGTPKGEHAFHGRIYQLMITRHVYDRRQIFDVYQGQKRALSTVRKNSDCWIGFGELSSVC
ncbi:hypothetical protein JH06_2426 [Blastocystis sp. subtype 4]|uniref:hypothetical protein n=1 Tax=Blastocystis sp. subtype 4 TaxID=944170 RepID=UPI000711BB5B|nr:hypothetical protein JH06_2426 [Blastocystis sp. subtype 4]KNB45566.1 hypothetical protein JH06_2426 [Blastocystis sp. subtype 4]|eukprot:XP_014528997.1 hypothetical protein JH06_2426 [Blastocystis sp. subtype 4]